MLRSGQSSSQARPGQARLELRPGQAWGQARLGNARPGRSGRPGFGLRPSKVCSPGLQRPGLANICCTLVFWPKCHSKTFGETFQKAYFCSSSGRLSGCTYIRGPPPCPDTSLKKNRLGCAEIARGRPRTPSRRCLELRGGRAPSTPHGGGRAATKIFCIFFERV